MILDDLASYLNQQGIGTVGQNIFKGILPEEPDTIIALYESGEGAESHLESNVDKQGITAIVRGSDYSVARVKADEVYKTLHGLSNVVLGSTRYLLIKAGGPPKLLAYDLNKRAQFLITFQVIYERS